MAKDNKRLPTTYYAASAITIEALRRGTSYGLLVANTSFAEQENIISAYMQRKKEGSMKIARRNDAFTRCVNERYAPDTDIYCAICGYGIYADEAVCWDENGQICHEECTEEGK